MPPTATHEPSQSVILAIDIGSSSVRALFYDRRGDRIAGSEVQRPYRQRVTAEGGSESDPETLLEETIQCVDGVLERAAGLRIAAIGMSSFWHGLMGVDRHGAPTTPVYMWSDKRSGYDAELLATDISISEAHARTGCRLHSSYWPAKLRWLARTRPNLAEATAEWVSITDHVIQALTGELLTSVSMASGTGLLNATSLEWDTEMASLAGVAANQLPEIVDRFEPLPALSRTYAERWPALRNVPWFPAIGDGAAANVGSGCVGTSRIAFTIGTSAAMRLVLPTAERIPPVSDRLWRYRLDRDFAVIGGALSNGGNAAAWVADRLADGDFDSLTEEAANLEPDAHGLTVLPLFAGERSPSWNEHATGAMLGLRHSTTPAAIFRATLEATAYRLSSIYDDLSAAAASPHQIHANGAAALGSPLWLQIIADTLGHEIQAVDAEAEASARGAAICALQAAGLIESLASVQNPIASSYRPDAGRTVIYAAAKARQSRLEQALNAIQPQEQEFA